MQATYGASYLASSVSPSGGTADAAGAAYAAGFAAGAANIGGTSSTYVTPSYTMAAAPGQTGASVVSAPSYAGAATYTGTTSYASQTGGVAYSTGQTYANDVTYSGAKQYASAQYEYGGQGTGVVSNALGGATTYMMSAGTPAQYEYAGQGTGVVSNALGGATTYISAGTPAQYEYGGQGTGVVSNALGGAVTYISAATPAQYESGGQAIGVVSSGLGGATTFVSAATPAIIGGAQYGVQAAGAPSYGGATTYVQAAGAPSYGGATTYVSAATPSLAAAPAYGVAPFDFSSATPPPLAAAPAYGVAPFGSSALGQGASWGIGGAAGDAVRNMPQFVFGAGGPPIDDPEPCPYSVGQAVEVYSVSESGWVPAKVSAVSPMGAVTVKYGAAQKEMQKTQQEGWLRPAVSAAPPLTIASGPQTGMKYEIGEPVDVFSKSEGGWVPAKVTAVAENGTVSVKWGARNQKDIAPVFFEEYLRPSAQASAPVFSKPMTMMFDATSPYNQGELVEVYSRSEGGWVQAEVIEVDSDGTVSVKWGPHMKKIGTADYEGFLRHIAAPPKPASMVFAAGSTSFSGVPAAMLPPTVPGDYSQYSQSIGNSPSSGVVPPTIPGGYSGMGMVNPAPWESSAMPGSGCLQNTPLDSSFTGELPPTNLGGMAPPTNFGGDPAGSGHVHYHDVPPTIPGGFS